MNSIMAPGPVPVEIYRPEEPNRLSDLSIGQIWKEENEEQTIITSP